MEPDIKAIETIKSEWKQDCVISETKILEDVARTPLLHSKYVNILADVRLAHKRIDNQLTRLKRAKIKYYKGEMTKEDLMARGWHQYQGIKVLKSDMDKTLSMEDDIIELETNVHYLEVAVKLLESIIKEISNRSYLLKLYVEHNKMLNGG